MKRSQKVGGVEFMTLSHRPNSALEPTPVTPAVSASGFRLAGVAGGVAQLLVVRRLACVIHFKIMNTHKPTDLETEIVKFAATLQAYKKPNRHLNTEEKAEAIKLKVLLGDLTAGAFSSASEFRCGSNPGPDQLPPPDRLTDADF